MKTDQVNEKQLRVLNNLVRDCVEEILSQSETQEDAEEALSALTSVVKKFKKEKQL